MERELIKVENQFPGEDELVSPELRQEGEDLARTAGDQQEGEDLTRTAGDRETIGRERDPDTSPRFAPELDASAGDPDILLQAPVNVPLQIPQTDDLTPSAGAAVHAEVRTISRDEGGDVAAVYVDTTGHPTAGVGHKLTAAERKLYPVGTEVPADVRQRWFEKDVGIAIEDASIILGPNAPDEVFSIVVNMAFNLGRTKLMKFAGLRSAIAAGDYARAADEMEWTNADTKTTHTPWFKQTGGRAKRLIARMRAI